jgi:tetratricopeptide (TPR) repeat protein
MEKHIFRLAGLLLLATIFLASCSDPMEESQRHVREGEVLLYQSKIDEAMEQYQEAARLNPENPQALYGVAIVLMNKGRFEEAIEQLDKAIAVKANYADAYYNRGQCHFYMGDRYSACDDWFKADSLGKPNLGDKLSKCY